VQTLPDDRATGELTASETKDRRIRYDESFKLDAIRLWKTSHRSAHEIARELGISAATLYTWGRELKPAANRTAAAQYMREMEEEIGQLREDNARLKLQCETLKKTLSILAEFPDTGAGKLKNSANRHQR
jgi:transposase-like protein